MKRKVLTMLLAATMILSMAGCASGKTPAEAKKESEKGGVKKVGVAMPTQSSQRWIQDGDNMKKQLEKLGYEVDLQYAEDDVQAQVSQIENLVSNGADCLVVAAVDSSALVNPLAEAKANGIPVIAYDRLLMDTDAVSYYATFDNEGVGVAIGEYIEKKFDLANATTGTSYNIEFFMGSPDDNNAVFLDAGVHSVLDKYLESGVLVCQSGQTDFKQTNTLRWSQETAQKRCEDILSGYYGGGEKIDIIASAFDGLSYGCSAALTGAGYTAGGEGWPVITGQDAELMAVKNIIAGSQTMSIFKDTRVLAEKCVKMVQAVLEGTEPEINDTETYNNNKLVVPSYLCTPVPVDKENYEKELVATDYYTADELK